jgi:hypothetical protein
MRERHFLFACTILLVVGLGLGTSLVQAQGDAKEKFQQAQKQNGAAQRQYTWMSRTELLLKGESKSVKVESVHYNSAGQQEKTEVESTPQQQQDQGGGRLKKHMIEKKKAEFKELMEGLGQLAQSYAHLSSEQIQALAQSATISQGQGEMQGSLRIQGTNVVVQGDTMTLWVDPATFLFRQVQINSLYEKKPMTLNVEFQGLPQGPTIPAHVTLDYPEKQVRVLIENYDYQRLQPPAGTGSAQAAPGAPPAGQGAPPPLDPGALDKLLAPVALYPDSLLGQILMCSMSSFQVSELAKWLQANSALKGSAVPEAAQKEGFDPSFVALSSFPQVVQMMADQPDWTRQLGQAFATDRSAVMDSIQRLRKEAMEAGALKSTPQQNVQTQTTQSGQQVIVVQPANPQVVYVPQYNPQTVYTAPPPQTTTVVVQESSSSSSAAGAAVVGFTAGVILGAAASDNYWGPHGMYDDAWNDWYDHREDMYGQYSENRQQVYDDRQQNADQRQTTRSENYDQRQATRSENYDQRQSTHQANVDSRQTTQSENQATRQASADERQTSRQTTQSENQATRQASADERQTSRQTTQSQNQATRQTNQSTRQESASQAQTSRQESASSRQSSASSSYSGSGSRGYSGSGSQASARQSGTSSGAFSGYSSGSSTRSASSRGQSSMSSSRSGSRSRRH